MKHTVFQALGTDRMVMTQSAYPHGAYILMDRDPQ